MKHKMVKLFIRVPDNLLQTKHDTHQRCKRKSVVHIFHILLSIYLKRPQAASV